MCYDLAAVMSGGRAERLVAPEGLAPREPDRVPAAGVTHLGHHPGAPASALTPHP